MDLPEPDQILASIDHLARECARCGLLLPLTCFRALPTGSRIRPGRVRQQNGRSDECADCETVTRPTATIPDILAQVDAAVRCVGAAALLRVGMFGNRQMLPAYARRALGVLDGSEDWPPSVLTPSIPQQRPGD